MGEAGIFTEDDRVELIDGDIFEMAPIGPAHAWIVGRLTELIVTRLVGKAHVLAQGPGAPRPPYRAPARPGGGPEATLAPPAIPRTVVLRFVGTTEEAAWVP